VPQGSVIAPLLFSIMLHDIQDNISTPGLFYTLFADDLAVWQDFNGKSKAFRKLWLLRYQTVMDKIEAYMIKNGFELSAEKTNLMVFTRQHKSRSEFRIHINGKCIQPSSSVKYLGVFLHQNLLWEQHIKNNITKAQRGVNLIKILSTQTWVSAKSLVSVVRALVRSRLMYGHEAFFSASNSQWLRLARIETRALKAALGLSKYAINVLVYQEVGWLPLKEECELACVNYQIRTAVTENCVSDALSTDYASNDDAFRQRLKGSKPRLHRQTTPFSDRVKQLRDASNLTMEDVEKTVIPVDPPWTLKSAHFEYSYGESVSKKEDPLFLSTLAKEKIDRDHLNSLKIFTDGSIDESGHAGSAFVVPENNVTQCYRLNKGVNVFTTELYAILMALTYMCNLHIVPISAVILSDSLSSLKALSRGGSNQRRNMQQNILKLIDFIIRRGTNLSIMWLPSHVGLKGNDIADCAAKKAKSIGTVVNLRLSVSEARNIVKRICREKYTQYIKQKCEEEGWIFLNKFGCHIPNLPRKNTRIISRIRTLSSCYLWVPLKCPCKSPASFQHTMSGCQSLSLMSPVSDFFRLHNLALPDLITFHQQLGDRPMRIFTNAIINADICHWF
jgi:ribonuclease HI